MITESDYILEYVDKRISKLKKQYSKRNSLGGHPDVENQKKVLAGAKLKAFKELKQFILDLRLKNYSKEPPAPFPSEEFLRNIKLHQ